MKSHTQSPVPLSKKERKNKNKKRKPGLKKAIATEHKLSFEEK
jgi:hypothetical protein